MLSFKDVIATQPEAVSLGVSLSEELAAAS